MTWTGFGVATAVIAVSITCRAAEPVKFGRDVLPILSTNCFACHGPDESERKAKLRLDVEADAKAKHDDGMPIVPGKPEQSTLIARLTSTDPSVVMPPPESHKTVKKEQIETLRRWISEGAKWGRHWSFEPVTKPEVASGSKQAPIDELVSRALEKKGLKLRPAASPQQLVRRLSLDLIGLPPTPDVADKFAAASTPQAYEQLVDELLKSPQFGEHWARMWLDLARYADTKGYEKDLGRTVWPYRDWVINAFNADMPLDQFTIEQLAGDLLPNATDEQVIATVFHRLTMSNDEGGTDDEEFRVAAVKDRIDTTLQVWMGLTAGCAKCHSHKYDPLPVTEYYSFYAVFNQTQDADRYDDSPHFEVASNASRAEREQLQAKLKQLNEELKKADAQSLQGEGTQWTVAKVIEATSSEGAVLKVQGDGAIAVAGKQVQEDAYSVTLELKTGTHTALRIEALPEAFPDGQLGVGRNPRDPNFVISELTVELLSGNESKSLKLSDARADYSQNGWPVAAAIDGNVKTGWAVSPRFRERHIAYFNFAEALKLDADAKLKVSLQQRYGDSLVLRRFRLATSSADASSLKLPQESPEQRKLRDEITATNAAIAKLSGGMLKVPVMRELADANKRTTKIHRRGNFLDQGDVVTAALPTAFHKLSDDTKITRLAAAQWLVHRDNPLTPRVWANRIWARLFGQGIVETEEDFGALGSAPSNPELLDWLAAEYRDGHWSLKNLLRTIVLSETYRQASDVTTAARDADPRNVLTSRGARYRLSAEVIRDQALTISGLLSLKKGGPPVMPPQPAGLWRSTYNGQKWVDAEGEDRFRRGLYTYLKRTTPYPSMTTFDGGSGEVCQIRRIRTNTPLQALITLNDPVYLEASAALAKRMVTSSTDAEARAASGLRLAVVRPLRDREVQPLVRLQKDAAAEFTTTPEKADALLKATRATVPEGMSKFDFAGWIVTANAILNLDEVLTRN